MRCKRWSVGAHFSDLFRTLDSLKPYLPDYSYWLCDLSRYSDAQLKGAVILRAGMLLLKYIWQEDLLERLKEYDMLLQELAAQETGLEYLQTMLRYIVGGTDKISKTELNAFVNEMFQEGDELMPTIAEQWHEEGRIEGLKQGREEGREEGREAALKLLRRFLAQRFGVALNHFDEVFQTLDLQVITDLSDIAFDVETLAEFEAKLAEMQADSD